MTKTLNIQERKNIKAVRKKNQVAYRITSEFSMETLKDRCAADSMIPSMLAQISIPSTSFNHHRWRK